MRSSLSIREVPSLADTEDQEPTAVRAVRSILVQERTQVLPNTMQKLVLARATIAEAASTGKRVRTYEVALDLDMSEFHFARQFRMAFDRSPHVFYDEVRADAARALLSAGIPENLVAKRIGFRRPAELRLLLSKRPAGVAPASRALVPQERVERAN